MGYATCDCGANWGVEEAALVGLVASWPGLLTIFGALQVGHCEFGQSFPFGKAKCVFVSSEWLIPYQLPYAPFRERCYQWNCHSTLTVASQLQLQQIGNSCPIGPQSSPGGDSSQAFGGIVFIGLRCRTVKTAGEKRSGQND